MSELDVIVTAEPHAGPQRLKFTFKPKDSNAGTAMYLANNGDINVPRGSGALTIRFHLKTESVNLGGSATATSLSFNPGIPLGGKRILKIWADGDPKTTTKWPAAFNAPAIGLDHRTITVSDDNLVSAKYRYRLAVGARTGEKTELIEVDPIIKNGGTRGNFLPPYIYVLGAAMIGALVAGGAVALYLWMRR